MTHFVGNRPAYHVTAPRNWINDPCAPLFWNGSYHIFYQHNPNSTVWEDEMHWGHAVSRDLVTWWDRPIALSPGPSGPDDVGCWSGCGRIIGGVPTFFYSGVTGHGADHAESVCIASGFDDLETLSKYPRNPVIPAVSGDSGLRNWRDPYVFEFKERTLMLLGTGLRVADGSLGSGAVVVFESKSDYSWEYSGLVFSQPEGEGPMDTGPVWECPQFVRFGDEWLLIVSVQLRPPAACYVAWFVGSFDGYSFVPSDSGVLDEGDAFYAPAVLSAPDGRILIWGWLQEADVDEAAARGRAGALSVARTLELVDGRPVMKPVDELDAVWTTCVAHARVALDDSHPEESIGESYSSYRLRFTVDEMDTAAGAKLFVTEGAEVTVVVERDGAEIRLVVSTPDGAAPLVAILPRTNPIRVDVFVDESIVEVCSEGQWISTRYYPTNSEQRDVVLFSASGSAAFCHVELGAFMRS